MDHQPHRLPHSSSSKSGSSSNASSDGEIKAASTVLDAESTRDGPKRNPTTSSSPKIPSRTVVPALEPEKTELSHGPSHPIPTDNTFYTSIKKVASSPNSGSLSLGDFCIAMASSPRASMLHIHKIIRATKGKSPPFLLIETETRHGDVIWWKMGVSSSKSTRMKTILSAPKLIDDYEVKIAGTTASLLAGEEVSVTVVVYSKPAETVLLGALSALTVCVVKEVDGADPSFFCNVVLRLCCEKFPHRRVGKIGGKSKEIEARDRIRVRFEQVLSGDGQ